MLSFFAHRQKASRRVSRGAARVATAAALRRRHLTAFFVQRRHALAFGWIRQGCLSMRRLMPFSPILLEIFTTHELGIYGLLAISQRGSGIMCGLTSSVLNQYKQIEGHGLCSS